MNSHSFTICRSVRQSSVLSPILFLLVMDPLLQELRQLSYGPSVCGLYLGAFSHSDDIRTLATNISDCQLQVSNVHNFASSQGFTLNVNKCEAIFSPSSPANITHITAGHLKIPVTNSAKCLGALWCSNLSCKKWVESNIDKARRALFARGSGIFLGKLNPLSSRSIIEHCVLPCLLYGAESWILHNTLLDKLESFQAKSILHLHRHAANNVAQMALQWPSMRARILIIKLKFLYKILTAELSLSVHTFPSLATSDVESLLLVRQCKFLESSLNSNFTASILTSPDTVSITSITEDILQLDLSLLFSEAATHSSSEICAANCFQSRGKLVKAVGFSSRARLLCNHAVLKFLALHSHSGNTCPVPNCGISLNNQSIHSHFLSVHSNLTVSIEDISEACINCSDSLFTYGCSLHNSFKSLWH